MKNWMLISLISLGFLGNKAFCSDKSISLVLPTIQKEFSLEELRKKLPVVTVTLDDPNFHSKKTFDGFKLNDVLNLLGPLPDDADEVVFTAEDGFAPSIPIKDFRAHVPILTFGEHGKEGYSALPHAKSEIDPGPFYVIWEDSKSVNSDFPWPYQLASIEVVSFKKKFPKLYPGALSITSRAMKGFKVFKANCLRCHSINLDGGEIGPELNIPKNITEYWKPDILQAYIRDVPSFRAKSKMPSFVSILSADQVKDVIAYLEEMKKHKVNPNAD